MSGRSHGPFRARSYGRGFTPTGACGWLLSLAFVAAQVLDSACGPALYGLPASRIVSGAMSVAFVALLVGSRARERGRSERL